MADGGGSSPSSPFGVAESRICSPKLATLPAERSFTTPSGVVTGKLIRVRFSDLSTDQRFKVRAIKKEFSRPGLRQQYLEAACEGALFPPLVAWREAERLIVLAGHDRLAAYQSQLKNYMGDQEWKKNLKRNPTAKTKSKAPGACEVYLVKCTEQEAKHIARNENATHGAPLTNKEKHELFLKIDKDDYYKPCRSDRYFARMLGVTHGTIQNWRKKTQNSPITQTQLRKRPRRKNLISAQEFFEQCRVISRRGVDCTAARRELTPEQLKVIGRVENFCHKARYGVWMSAALRDGKQSKKSNQPKMRARSGRAA